jgi:hypothetical protein
MAHAVVWFDVPVTDLDRAARFYSGVLGRSIKHEFPDVAVLAHGDGEVAGCLVRKPGHLPVDGGPLLYFSVSGRLDEAVRLVPELGGKVIERAHPIGPFGFRAIVLDSEGNRIALHSD